MTGNRDIYRLIMLSHKTKIHSDKLDCRVAVQNWTRGLQHVNYCWYNTTGYTKKKHNKQSREENHKGQY